MPANDADKIWAAYAKGVKPIAAKKNEHVPLPSRDQVRKNSGKGLVQQEAGLLSRDDSSSAKTGDLLRKPKFSQSLPQGKRNEKIAASPLHVPLDRNVERRLRQGAIAIETRLDLHGMRQNEAHEALQDFIKAQAKAGRRNLLIITGKGRTGPGVLRARLADWLAASPLAARILALRPAAIRHGGAGAFYVMLKKWKN